MTNVRKHQASDGQFQRKEMPTEWGEKYTDQDKEDIEFIVSWCNTHRKSMTWLAAAASVNRTTAHQVLKGLYDGNVHHYCKKMASALQQIEARRNVKESPFIESSVTQIVNAACNRARKYQSFAVITAEVGTGKTRSLKEYCAAHEHTVMIEADPIMSPTALLEDLVVAFKVQYERAGYLSREKKFKLLVENLKGRSALIILDEAETVNPVTLEHLRRIRDKTGIGIVLAGTPKLRGLIAPEGGQFDQIRSRTCFMPPAIRAITLEDATAVIVGSFEDQGDVDSATIKAIWHHCQGSMRMLVEDLIPAIRDYGLKKHKLSADLVHAVARDVLSLSEQ